MKSRKAADLIPTPAWLAHRLRRTPQTPAKPPETPATPPQTITWTPRPDATYTDADEAAEAAVLDRLAHLSGRVGPLTAARVMFGGRR